MQDIYLTEQYADLNPTWHEEDSPWKARQVADLINRNKVEVFTFCEVGCGTGEILMNLSHSFPHVQFTGYEIAPHAYNRAKQKETSQLSFKFGDVLEENVTSFDVVLVADVIEHVENYIGFIKGLKSVGRYKIFHIPLDLSVQSLYRSWPITNLRKNVGHIHSFFKESALETLKDCGYSIVDFKYTASRLELPNQALSSRLMKLPRQICFYFFPDWTVRVLGGYSLLVLAE